jgi:hypothetical protein
LATIDPREAEEIAVVEPADAKELIQEAIGEVERVDHAERQLEKRFRDRVSILVGIFAVLLAAVNIAMERSDRQTLLKTVQESDTYNYMQAKIIRETVMKTAAENPSYDAGTRAAMLKEADRLRNPDAAGHGIGQLQRSADELRDEGEAAADAVEWYERGETAMQVSIVLLSIALVARSRAIVAGAVGMALVGVLMAAATAAGAL